MNWQTAETDWAHRGPAWLHIRTAGNPARRTGQDWSVFLRRQASSHNGFSTGHVLWEIARKRTNPQGLQKSAVSHSPADRFPQGFNTSHILWGIACKRTNRQDLPGIAPSPSPTGRFHPARRLSHLNAEAINNGIDWMAPRTGFEPVTCRLGGGMNNILFQYLMPNFI